MCVWISPAYNENNLWNKKHLVPLTEEACVWCPISWHKVFSCKNTYCTYLSQGELLTLLLHDLSDMFLGAFFLEKNVLLSGPSKLSLLLLIGNVFISQTTLLFLQCKQGFHGKIISCFCVVKGENINKNPVICPVVKFYLGPGAYQQLSSWKFMKITLTIIGA